MVQTREREPWLTLRGSPWDRPRLPLRRKVGLRPVPGRPRGPVSGEAVNALRQAMRWEGELAEGQVNRADIARREGISRARVTQIMGLLKLSGRERRALLDGTDMRSIRSCLRRLHGVR